MVECEIKEYVREDSSPFRHWFNDLDSQAASRVTTALYRLQYGNFSNVRSVAAGFQNTRLILVPVTESILGRMGTH